MRLLSNGIKEAKRNAALALAQMAYHAEAGCEIAEEGGISPLVEWLIDPNEGPAEVAANALANIAFENADTQSQIAEEGAVPPLVAMISAWAEAMEAAAGTLASSLTVALRLANAAAGTLATLAKDNFVNQIIIAEEGGIPPLLELLNDKTAMSHENATQALWYLSQQEDNQTAIPKAGGISPLVALLITGSELSKLHSAAALRALARDHVDNQIALTSAGAIQPLAGLLGSNSKEMQEQATGALLYLASNDKVSRNAVVQKLVGVLHVRSAAAQMKAAKALAVLARYSNDNRKAITEAQAIVPLVNLLGDGRRVKSDTPQERAAAVLADLARLNENKKAIIAAGSAEPLVQMLSSTSNKAQTNASTALMHLSSAGENKAVIAKAGAITPLVDLLANGAPDAKRSSMGALFQLAAVDKNRAVMVAAGIIPQLVKMLGTETVDVREHASAVLANLGLAQGGKGNKRAIVHAGAIQPLVELLSDSSITVQKHAACTLWSLAAGKDGMYDRYIVEHGGVVPLVKMLLLNHPDTCGFAAAALSCLCADATARKGIIEAGATDPLLALVHGPSGWLRTQAIEMLKLLGIPFTEPEEVSPRFMRSPRDKEQREGDGSTPSLRLHPLTALKELPIRTDRFVDPNRENPKVGLLKVGDTAYVLERREVVSGTWRALITLQAGGEPRGWVTAGKDGNDFLVSKSAPGASKNIKFHFWPHQVKTTTVDCVHFS